MFFLNIKRRETYVTLPMLLAGIILFNLICWLTSTTEITEATTMVANYAYAEEVATDNNKDLSSIVTSFNAYPRETDKKNDIQIIDFDNSSDKIREIGSKFNFSNTLVSENQFKNETSFPFNITNAIDSSIAGSSSSSSDAAAQAASEVTSDFNGDGFEDKAIGAYGEEFGSLNTTGAVHVIYGSSGGLSATAVLPDQLWTQNSEGIEGIAEDWDYFGSLLSAGDYNNDGFDDLAIGVYGEDIDLAVASLEDFDISINSALVVRGTGVVQVIYGSSGGLSSSAVLPDQVLIQGFGDIEDFSENYDGFGTRLSSGDYNGDGFYDLAVGKQYEETGSLDNTGGVHVIYGSSGGLSATAVLPDQLWTQNTDEIEDEVENGDEFGSSLSSGDYNSDGRDDLAIGVHQEDIDSIAQAGAVHVIYGSSEGLSVSAVLADQFWTQNSPGIDDDIKMNDYMGPLSSGDYNGDGRDDLAIGAYNEDIGSIANAGAVHVIYGSAGGLSASAVLENQKWTQDSIDIQDIAESNNQFGSTLSSGDYNGDGFYDLAIGVNHEGIGSIAQAGIVQIIYGSSGGLSATAVLPDQLWRQGLNNIDDVPETNDWFAYSLSSGDYNGDGRNDLAIGVVGEDINFALDAGTVHIIYGSSDGLSATAVLADQQWIQGLNNLEDNAEFLDYFGWSF